MVDLQGLLLFGTCDAASALSFQGPDKSDQRRIELIGNLGKCLQAFGVENQKETCYILYCTNPNIARGPRQGYLEHLCATTSGKCYKGSNLTSGGISSNINVIEVDTSLTPPKNETAFRMFMQGSYAMSPIIIAAGVALTMWNTIEILALQDHADLTMLSSAYLCISVWLAFWFDAIHVKD